MGKRLLYHVDSPCSENLYYSLCISIPQALRQEFLLLEPSSLASFERFYYVHKNEVDIKYYLADCLYAGIIGLFAVIFNTNEAASVETMNSVLDSVFLSHTREEARALVYEHDRDVLLTFINGIERELLARDEEENRGLLAKCHDINNTILRSQPIHFPASSFSEDAVITYGHKIMNTAIESWVARGDSLESYRKQNHPYDEHKLGLDFPVVEWSSDATELDNVMSFGQEMNHLVEKVIYDYDSLTETERNDFIDLWLLMVTIHYKGLLPSSFYRAIKLIVPH